MLASRGSIAAAVAAALTTAGGSAGAQPRPSWGDVSLSLDALLPLPSDYDETLRIFDHAPLEFAVVTALRVTARVRPWLHLGGRAGWLWTASAALPTPPDDPSASANGSMSFNVVDLGGVARLVATPEGVRRGGLRMHVDVEAGLALGNVSMLAVTQRWVRPRVGAALLVGHQARTAPLYVGARLGFQFLPWDGAGGSAVDPVFSGAHLGLEAGYLP